MTIWRLECHDELESTSDLCRARAEAGAEEGLAVLARRQTAGRGTRGRSWVDPGGNLAFSFLIRPSDPPSAIRAMPFMAAIAIFDAVRLFLSADAPLLIKWPNDILLDGGKLSGTLIEAGGGERPWVVVGIGVNIATTPTLPERKLASLAGCARPVPKPEALARQILANMTEMGALFGRSGFPEIRHRWLARAHPFGTPLAVSSGGQYISGSFSGLDGDGTLLLRADGGKELRFVTGDVLLTG